MQISKQCKTCKEVKPLSEFFQAAKDGANQWSGTSEHCKQCHSEAKVPHGYGWYGDKWKSPEDTK